MKRKFQNRFNNISSKEWLPFQKSWFKYSDTETLYAENIRFFSKIENADSKLLYFGNDFKIFEREAMENDFHPGKLQGNRGPAQFIMLDLRYFIFPETTQDEYEQLRKKVMTLMQEQLINLDERRFVAIFIPNSQKEEIYRPFAWDLAKHLGKILSLKDEKIGCIEDSEEAPTTTLFTPSKESFYSLYFRKDERSGSEHNQNDFDFFRHTEQQSFTDFEKQIPSWFILKPKRRGKNEILHPAKFPEELVEMFITEFTKPGENVFDPMSGTGSTQLGAMQLNRNGYGTELSEFFAEIAQERCSEFIQNLDQHGQSPEFKILNKDARHITAAEFPEIDYVFTSPPYWDMLNMKGAENQAKRIKKGLQTNYSDDPDDLGNIAEYYDFLDVLKNIYFNIASLMKPGSVMTIVVKNIKKKGSNYPFAWDLSTLLQEKLILLPEVFWLQDDISIAPYGYGNTWVSNTFHQYCLNFQIPEDFRK